MELTPPESSPDPHFSQNAGIFSLYPWILTHSTCKKLVMDLPHRTIPAVHVCYVKTNFPAQKTPTDVTLLTLH